MKKNVFVVSILAVILAVSCNTKGGGYSTTKPTKDVDSASYIIGVLMGKNLRNGQIDSTFNLDLIAQGIYDELNSKKFAIPFNGQESVLIIQDYILRKNTEAGKKFLEQAAKKSGVKKTASGLLYEVMKEGNGPKPTAESIVKVHYKGTFTNGSTFDSSIERGEPAVFPLNQVIKGWTEGLQLMTIGSKYKFYVPGELGYGAQGQPQGGIGPNQVLVFEVELLSIEKEMPKQEAQGQQGEPQMDEETMKKIQEQIKQQQAQGK
ncbi:MAG: FKBP-type peptidyl-prolyl cis-trans isomerase [Chitinophagales bacterium]|nr:FKBP-type peptidyl-prolyl cis-trans isomerase [Chitinophagales bacterium]